MKNSVANVEPSKWPHRCAIALACATFPLIWVGGLVTTYDAGMAVPDWPTTYGYNMFLYPWEWWISGPWDLFIEHGHRLLGSLVGLLTIALNVAIWRFDTRSWVRWLGAMALLLVIFQGVLGGMRVRMASTDLARAHGCTGPLFFALAIVLCTTTSRYWFDLSKSDQSEKLSGISRSAVAAGWLLFAMAYLQLVLGAHLRHPGIQWSPGIFRSFVLLHVVVALLILIKALAVAGSARSLVGKLKSPARLLAILVIAQVALGVAAWRAKYGWPSFLPFMTETQADKPVEIAIHNALAGGTVAAESMSQALTVTAHVALGSLILAASVCYATRLSRAYCSGQKTMPDRESRTETATRTVLSSILVGGTTS